MLLVTTDGGARWTPQVLPVPPGRLCSSGCEAYSPPRFFGQDGFMAIGDAGAYPRTTFFSCQDGRAGICGPFGGIAATTADGGATWTVVPLGRSFTADGTEFDFTSPRTGFAWAQAGDAAAAGPPAIDETTDSGRTWTSFTPVLANG